MGNHTDISIRHLDLSDNFFDLVQAVLLENILQGNRTGALMKKTGDFQEIDRQYRLQTKWSDQRILIPILFNFFHGIELYLKGVKYLSKVPEKSPDHKLKDLAIDFKADHPNKILLNEIFEYYIFPDENCPILNDFYKSNEIVDSSMFYEIFKYPSNRSFEKTYDFKALKRNHEKGVNFFEKIVDDIDKL